MRPSTVLLAGAAAAHAASLPDFWHQLQDQFEKGIQDWMDKTEDLSIFGDGPLHTISFEDAKAKADQKNAEALENDTLPHEGTTSTTQDISTKPTKGKGKGNGRPSKGNNSNDEAVTKPTAPIGSDGGNGTTPEDPNGMKRCDTMNTRKEWRRMSTQEQNNFMDAVICLMDKPASGEFSHTSNRYEDIVYVHQQMSGQIHGSQIFLPWHRNYLHAFSVTLRNECNYVGSLPWWDETLDAGNFAASPLFTPEAFGTLHKAMANGRVLRVNDGRFHANDHTLLSIGPDMKFNNNHNLTRAVDDEASKQCNNDFINACNAMPDYADMHDCNEEGPHAYGHIAVGGVMKDVTASPGDPVFFLHHGFVDRMFKKWQDVQTSRHSTISGCADKEQDCTPLTMDTILSTKNLVPDVSVGDIMWAEGEFLCYEYDY